MIKPIGTEDKPLDWFKPDPRELARHNDPEKTRQLGENMLARGQLQEVAATEDGRIIFGHGRYLGAKTTDIIKTLRTILYPASLSSTEFRLIWAAENLQRNELTAYQRWILFTDLLCGNPDWKQADLAKALNVSEKTVSVTLTPSKCIPEFQEGLKNGLVSLSDCAAASKLPLEQQGELLKLKLISGASRDALEREGRKRRNGNGQAAAVRVSKIKCPLPSGVTVQISGEGIDLELALESAQEWVKEVKRAIDQGFDAKTFERVCRDKSKKG